MTELDFARLCAGVHWMRLKNRERYAALRAEVRNEGGDAKAWSAEVQQAADNGFVVTEEREPA